MNGFKLKFRKAIVFFVFVKSSGKTRLTEGQKDQALIIRRAFCAANDQSLDFWSHMNICRKHFSRFLHNLKKIFEYNYIEKADLGKHCFLLHKPGFPR